MLGFGAISEFAIDEAETLEFDISLRRLFIPLRQVRGGSRILWRGRSNG